jgi:hypothetical protein
MALNREVSQWEGPIRLTFSRFKETGKTVRYRAPLKTRAFDLYVSRVLLAALVANALPEKLTVLIGASVEPLRRMGFHGHPIPPSTDSDCWEYDFHEEKANSIRYSVVYEGAKFSLYVPKELFGDQDWPQRVYLQMISGELKG